MEDKMKLKIKELRTCFEEIKDLILSDDFKPYLKRQIKVLSEKIMSTIHEVNINPLLRQYYSYQLCSIGFSYFLFIVLSFTTLTSRYGFTARVFFPHYLTLHWLILSVGVGFILYKLNKYYHYEIVMREKLVANGEKGTADWANEKLNELKDNEDELLKIEGLVIVPIDFKTLEELEEEKLYLENEIEKIKKQLEEENKGKEDICE